MTHWMRPSDIDRERKHDRFDPAVEGACGGLSREASFALWERVCADTTDSTGRRDEELARQQFQELAVTVAAHGRQVQADAGRITRVAVERNGSSPGTWSIDELRPRVPGRETLVTVEARRRMVLPSTPGQPVQVGDDEASPRLGFDDYRVLGLKDLLLHLGPDHALRPDIVATAASADRSIAGRATLWRERLPSAMPPTSHGHALWQASERHAATLYRRAVSSGLVDTQDPAVESALQQRGTGELLPRELRRTLERELGVELQGVRIHTDAMAAQAARALAADAFTVGEDIFFADGMFSPDTRAGRQLLAHELTHVAQALRGHVGPVGDGLRVSQPGEPLEQEADAVAARVDAAPAPRIRTPSTGGAAHLDDNVSSTSPRLPAPQRSLASHVLRTPAASEQMAKARPAAQSDFVLHAGKDDFVVSFELLPKAGAGGNVRVVVSPTDFSRARQSLMKYWDVRGREVNKDDSWTSMGNVGTEATSPSSRTMRGSMATRVASHHAARRTTSSTSSAAS